LVENAIKHGIARRAQGGEVRVAASRSDGHSPGMREFGTPLAAAEG
jgi:hypothetical protein